MFGRKPGIILNYKISSNPGIPHGGVRSAPLVDRHLRPLASGYIMYKLYNQENFPVPVPVPAMVCQYRRIERWMIELIV